MHFDAEQVNEMCSDRLAKMEEDLSRALNSVTLKPKDSKMDTFG